MRAGLSAEGMFLERPVQIGLLGLGTVGSGVAHILHANAEGVAAKARSPLTLRRVAVRDVHRRRDVAVDPDMLTADPWEIVQDPDVDIIVEVMGGVDPARALMEEALRRGKPVVTANKEVVARHGAELLA